MLEGNNIHLRLRDKEDLDFFFNFWNTIDYYSDTKRFYPKSLEHRRKRESKEAGSQTQVWIGRGLWLKRKTAPR